MKRLYLTLTLCSLAFMLTPVFAQDTTTGAVEGTVTDAGIPLEGVRVAVASTDGVKHETLTDSKGEFNIAGLAPGRYLMSFTKEGYERRADKPITVTAGGVQYISRMMSKKGPMAIDMVNPTLKAIIMSKTGIVRGRVRDTSPAPKPIEGVRVVIRSVQGLEFEAQTDGKGEFEMTGLPSARYVMSCYKQGYESNVDKPVTLAEGGDQYMSMTMSKTETVGSVDDVSSKAVIAENSASQQHESRSPAELLLLYVVAVAGVIVFGH